MYGNYHQEPDYPAALSHLSHLDAEELKELLNNDDKFEDMMKDIKQFKDLETEKEMLIASNKSLAEFNLSKEPQLQEGKRRLMELSEKGEAISQRVESKLSEIRQRSGNSALETTLALLQTAAAETEEESEKIAEKFLDGELEVDDFLETFDSRRKLMHLRRVKADKMTELMSTRRRHAPPPPSSQLSGIGRTPPHHMGGPSSYYPLPPTAASSVPYPLGPVNMPLPAPFGASSFA